MEHFIVYDYVLTNYVQICNLHAYGNCSMLAVQDDDDQPLSPNGGSSKAPKSSNGTPRSVANCPATRSCGSLCPSLCVGPASCSVGSGKRSVLTRDSPQASAQVV